MVSKYLMTGLFALMSLSGFAQSSEDVDLKINATVDPACVDANMGNYHKLVVTNIGAIEATYGGESIIRPAGNMGTTGIYNRNRIELALFVPNTYNLVGNSYSGWELTVSANTPAAGFTTYTYLSNFTSVTPITGNTAPTTLNSMLNTGASMPAITFNIRNGAGVNEDYVLKPTVRWILESGTAIKPNSLPSTNWAYTPTPARTNLEVPENLANNTTNITMTVRPTPGAISTMQPVVCKGSSLTQISNTLGTGATGSVVSYRWERSEDDGDTWIAVAGQTERTYFPQNLLRTTLYRRITRATLAGKTCESVPTAVMKITVRNCTVISNPMMPSKARNN